MTGSFKVLLMDTITGITRWNRRNTSRLFGYLGMPPVPVTVENEGSQFIMDNQFATKNLTILVLTVPGRQWHPKKYLHMSGIVEQ